ncbi:MAG: thiamine-phosphate kinase, partial [Acidobacteria bacterium]
SKNKRTRAQLPHKQNRRVWGTQAYFFPEPRLALGNWLGRRRLATSMIDLSDGLSSDLAHICDESRVGAVVYEDAIPTADRGVAALKFALHGGEDYELLFTARAKAKVRSAIGGVKIARIGEIVRSSGMWLVEPDGRRRPLRPLGWQHFGRNR